MINKINYIHTIQTHNTRAAEAFIPILFSEIGVPNSVVDVGCGTGTWLSVFKEKGVKNILGIDGDNVDLDSLYIEKSEFKSVDLSQSISIDKRFELAICLEVAEHLPESASEVLIDTLCGLSNRILFSAAMANQGGQNHVNEQFFEYWKTKFNQRGYICKDIFRSKIWNNSTIDYWYRQNMYLIEKIDDKPITQAYINAYYHPELYTYKFSKYNHTLNSYKKILNGEIPITLSLKILIKSLLYSLKK